MAVQPVKKQRPGSHTEGMLNLQGKKRYRTGPRRRSVGQVVGGEVCIHAARQKVCYSRFSRSKSANADDLFGQEGRCRSLQGDVLRDDDESNTGNQSLSLREGIMTRRYKSHRSSQPSDDMLCVFFASKCRNFCGWQMSSTVAVGACTAPLPSRDYETIRIFYDSI